MGRGSVVARVLVVGLLASFCSGTAARADGVASTDLGFVRFNYPSNTELVSYLAPGFTSFSRFGGTGYPSVGDPENVTALALDIDGDGRDEIGFLRMRSTANAELVAYGADSDYKFQVFNGNTGYPSIPDPQNVKVVAIDIDGDGRDEIGFVRLKGHASGKTELVAYSPASAYKNVALSGATGYPAVGDPQNVTPVAIDQDGDFKQELGFVRVRTTANAELVTYSPPAYTGIKRYGDTGYPAVSDPQWIRPIVVDSDTAAGEEIGFLRFNHSSGKTELVSYSPSSNFKNITFAAPTGYPNVGDLKWIAAVGLKRARYPVSYRYGGGDHRVNTTGEAQNVVGAVDQQPSHAAASALLGQLDPGDRALVNTALVARLADGDLAYAVDTGGAWNYAYGQLRPFPDLATVTAVGANLATAKRITSAAANTLPWGSIIGPYKTSWDYGGANRAVDTDAEADAVLGALSRLPDGTEAAFLDGLTGQDRSLVLARQQSSVSSGGASFTVPEDSDDNAVNADSSSLSTDAVVASAAALPAPGQDMTVFSTDGGAQLSPAASAAGTGGLRSCQPSRFRDGLRQYTPYRVNNGRSDDVFYSQGIMSTFKQNRARRLYRSDGSSYTSKQFILCSVGNARALDKAKAGIFEYHQTVWMRTSISRVLPPTRWATGQTPTGLQGSLSFTAGKDPVSITATIDLPKVKGRFTGFVGLPKYLSWSSFSVNMVTGSWIGDEKAGGFLKGVTDQVAQFAISNYEMPQSARNPKPEFTMAVSAR